MHGFLVEPWKAVALHADVQRDEGLLWESLLCAAPLVASWALGPLLG